MTVPEAAIKILQEYPDGLSAKKVTDEILAHKLHPLPAKDPVQIVARAMNRHCIGIDRSYSCQDRFFTASKDNTGLLIYEASWAKVAKLCLNFLIRYISVLKNKPTSVEKEISQWACDPMITVSKI